MRNLKAKLGNYCILRTDQKNLHLEKHQDRIQE